MSRCALKPKEREALRASALAALSAVPAALPPLERVRKRPRSATRKSKRLREAKRQRHDTIAATVEERTGWAQQLMAIAKEFGNRSAAFANDKHKLIAGLEARGSTRAAAEKRLERDLKHLGKDRELRAIGCPSTLHHSIEALLPALVTAQSLQGKETNKYVVQAFVQTLREETTQNAQPGKTPSESTTKRLCAKLLKSTSTEPATPARQRAFLSLRDVLSWAAAVKGDRIIVLSQVVSWLSGINDAHSGGILRELAFSSDTFGFGLGKDNRLKRFVGKEYQKSLIAPKRVQTASSVHAFLKIVECIGSDGSVLPFVVQV